MRASKIGPWIAGTVAIALVIALAAWFLLISPVMATAGETSDQADATHESNALLQVKITRLKAQFEEIETYKAELASMRLQVPTSADLAEYLRQLDSAAAAHGVTVVSVLPSTPAAVEIDPATIAGATDGAVSGTVADEATAAADDAVAEAVASILPVGFYDIPVAITAVGSYANVLAFVESVQSGTQRLFLASGMTGTSQDDREASGGRPATSVGDLEVTITGVAFVLTDPAAAPVDPAAAPVPLPGAVDGKNPLVPIG